MTHRLNLVILLFVALEKGNCTNCGDWIAFKDSLCVKLFDRAEHFVNQSAASDFCAGQASANLSPSLLRIDSEELSTFLQEVIFGDNDILDNVWIGAKFDNDSGTFLWEDGSEMTYTDWATGNPRLVTDEDDTCVEVRPPNAMMKSESKWYDVSCRKRNIVVCEKHPTWTLDEVVHELIELRKQIVPIGFIYTEYADNPNPSQLWPTMEWEDISPAYAGQFFRVLGGQSDAWGTIQGECAPKISHVQYYGASPDIEELPQNGWSNGVRSGDWSSGANHANTAMRFRVAGCEVRPRNQAVRIWKRVA